MISKKDFFQLMTEAGNAYGKDVNKGQLSAYYDALSGFDALSIQKAFKSHVLTVAWFPRISEIIGAIEGTGKEKSADAWASVMIEIRKTGSYGRPRVTPEIREAIDKVGGWKVICRMNHKELEFKAKDFADVYQAPVSAGTALNYRPSAGILRHKDECGEQK